MQSALSINTCHKLFLVLLACTPLSLQAQVQPRDLDDNPATIEAYYDPFADITALAHPNLPLLETFGIPTTVTGGCPDIASCEAARIGIDQYGFMEWPTADNYVDAMNTAGYLGQNTWRLPAAGFVFSSLFGWVGDSHELDEILGQRHSMQLPLLPGGDYRFLSNHFHPQQGRAYIGSGSTLGTGISTIADLTRFAVWPVLDGDVGSDVIQEARLLCNDLDGDGFGWNGSDTCTPFNYNAFIDTVDPLQPRDLDGNTDTIEAYYHPQLNITWLADSRLAATENFNLLQVLDGSFSTSRVNADGSFSSVTAARTWLRQLNETLFNGYSGWRFPRIVRTFESIFPGIRYDSEFDVLADFLPQLTIDEGETFDLQMGSYFVQEDSQISAQTAQVSRFNNQSFVFISTTNFNDDYFVWPVHDGDIGSPVTDSSTTASLDCIDTDGDGWGWDGTNSCQIENTEPVATSCMDTDGDGWGWNGVATCNPE